MNVESLNESLFFALQSFSNPLLDWFFQVVTNIGSPLLWIVVSALFFWKGEEKNSFFLMNTVIASSILAGFIKTVFKQPRPQEIFQAPKNVSEHGFFVPTDNYSFPSGHAATISSVFAFFYHKIKKSQKIIFAVLLVLVLVSRVYLGKHFSVDVLAGLAIGLVVGFVMLRFNNWFYQTPLRREAGIIIMTLFFLMVVFLYEKFSVITLALGHYLGFFLFKEFGFDSTSIFGKKFFLKAIVGLLGLGTIILYLVTTNHNLPLQATLFFSAGLWTTLIFPALFEIIVLKKKTNIK